MNCINRKGLLNEDKGNIWAILIILIVFNSFIACCLSRSDLSKSLFLFINILTISLFMYSVGKVCQKYTDHNKILIHEITFTLCLYFIAKSSLALFTVCFSGRLQIELFSGEDASWLFLAIAAYLFLACYGGDRKRLLVISIVFSMLLGYTSWIEYFPFISKIIVFLPYFLLGLVCETDNFHEILQKKWINFFCGNIVIILSLLLWWFPQKIYLFELFFTGVGSYKEIGEYAIVGGALRLVTYIIGIIMVYATEEFLSSANFGRYLNRLDNRFIVIYFWHIPVIYIFNGLHILDMIVQSVGHKMGLIIWVVLAFLCIGILSSNLFCYILELFFKGLERVKKIIFSDNWNVKEYVLIYTIMFLGAFLISWSPILSDGKTFVWMYDGRTQHYPLVLYYGRYLRNILASIFDGKFYIPPYDTNIGLGENIIGILGSNGILDPLFLFTALVPVQYSEILYEILVILRLYFSGLSFSFLCCYFKKEKPYIL